MTNRSTRYQVEEKYSTGTWQRQAYDDLTGALTAKDKIFPCIYGMKEYKANELDFVVLESENLNDLEITKVGAKAIVDYHKLLKQRGRNISLVLLCPPRHPRSNAAWKNTTSSFGHSSNKLDPKPWPAKISHNTLGRQ